MAEPFLGEVRLVSFRSIPQGWAPCDGQILQRSQNAALFALIGDAFGGDGQTTFALPDLRGRAPTGAGEPSATDQPARDSGPRGRLLDAWRRVRQPRGLTGLDVQFIICIQGGWPERW